MNLQELRNKRQGLVGEARGVTETARAENPALAKTEVERYDVLMKQADDLKATIDAEMGRLYPQENADTREQPYGQRSAIEYRDGEVAILSGQQRMADVARSRGVAYATESRTEPLRLGRIVTALATGNRKGMSDLEQRAMSSGIDGAGGWTVPEILAT